MKPGQGMAKDGFEIDGWKRPLQGDLHWNDWSGILARKAFQTEGSLKELVYHI